MWGRVKVMRCSSPESGSEMGGEMGKQSARGSEKAKIIVGLGSLGR